MPAGKKNKKLKSTIQQYFDFQPDKSICLIGGCKKEFKSTLCFNLKRHIIKFHKDIAQQNDWLRENEEIPLKEFTIFHSKEKILSNLVKLVTKDGLPLAVLNYESFKNIVEPLYNATGVSVNISNILPLIELTATTFKKMISEKVDNKFINLKIDGATSYRKSIIGINIQLIENGKINIMTLSMMEILESHTSENIKNRILEVFTEYNIKISSLYSVTTDNGANMIKAVKLLSAELSKLMLDDAEIDKNSLETEPYSQTEMTEETIIFTDDIWTIQSIKCAAYTLQLAVHDAVRAIGLESNLEEIRKVVKKLRRSPYFNEFKLNNKKIIPIDVATRWSSTFYMLEVIVEQEEFILSVLQKYNIRLLKKFKSVLPIVKLYHKTLKPVAIATKELQENQLVLGDLFKNWLEVETELEDIATETGENILLVELRNEMKRRKSALFENEIFLASIYLDPRFNYINSKFLKTEEKNIAKEHLSKLQQRIRYTFRNLEEATGFTLPQTASTLSPSSSLSSSTSMSSELPKKMSRLEKRIQDEERGSIAPTANFQIKLDNLSNRERLPIESDVLSYWETFKHDNELYELSQIVLATPATQVSVERAFSGLAHILTSLRTNLKKENLNNILLVKLNQELFSELDLHVYK